MHNSIYVGLDVGGSSTTLCASLTPTAWDSPVAKLEGPGANLKREGLSTCASTISDLVNQSRSEHAAESCYVCAGVAGASTHEERRQLEQELARLTKATVHIVPDARLALETAFPGQDGLIIIAGTGSIVYGRTLKNQYVRAGGWGAILGDEGSGYNLAIGGLRAVTHALDGGPSTDLTDVFSDNGISTRKDILEQVYEDGARPQKLAPIVIKSAANDDEVASHVLMEQVAGLADQAAWTANRHENITPRISGFGGMMHHPIYQETLHSALAKRLPNWSVVFSTESPARGALYLATRIPQRT